VSERKSGTISGTCGPLPSPHFTPFQGGRTSVENGRAYRNQMAIVAIRWWTAPINRL